LYKTEGEAMPTHDTATVVRTYHDAWTAKDFAQARALLADGLIVEVPVNHYPTAQSFGAALEGFGSTVSGVSLLAAMSDGDEAMLLYDLDAVPVGTLRVAEHFTVSAGKITRIRQIHDTAAVRAAGLAQGYDRQLTINAAREHVFDALTSLDGLRHWWTTIVTGSPATGGELCFGFAGSDELIVMRVDEFQPPAVAGWSCTAHTRDSEWTGSALRFDLTERGPRACELRFRHTGIDADLVAAGWDSFLASLAAYAERGAGSPYGA
jgi:uncharacterized protein YndB with AHSA1/START domain